MSRIAGRLAPQMGAWSLQMANGGSGLLLGGVPGVPPARVLVIGAGTVGANATRIAVGMGADVTLFDRGTAPLDDAWIASTAAASRPASTILSPCADQVADADVVIGAVLIPGQADAAAHSPRPAAPHAARARSWWMSPSTRAVSPRLRARPATPTRSTSRRAWCITASPTCPAPVPALPPWRWPRPRLPYAVRSPSLGLRAALLRDAGLQQGLQIHRRPGHPRRPGAGSAARACVGPDAALGL